MVNSLNASVRPGPAAPAGAPALPPAPVDPAMAALVAGLNRLNWANVPLTAEGIAAWRTNFMQLVQSGPSAVPALRAFLDQKVDYTFSQEAWQGLGYSSARLAAIDALRQIGGPDALAAMQSILGTSSSPREIAVLAWSLEEASPGHYRGQALAAAREGLQAAVSANNPQLDVAPLFEVFQRYGDASAIPELEAAMDRWRYYATIALANLPDGAGIPSILRQADPGSGSGNRLIALEMVAQLAGDNAAAREALINQVKANQIAPDLWSSLTSPLAGDQYFPVDSAITQYPQLQSASDVKTTHLASGNQNFYTLPGYRSLTPEVIAQRVALVDELLGATSDPLAQRALSQARELLSRRYNRPVAQTQPATDSGQ